VFAPGRQAEHRVVAGNAINTADGRIQMPGDHGYILLGQVISGVMILEVMQNLKDIRHAGGIFFKNSCFGHLGCSRYLVSKRGITNRID
jgi:hypothetical protein